MGGGVTERPSLPLYQKISRQRSDGACPLPTKGAEAEIGEGKVRARVEWDAASCSDEDGDGLLCINKTTTKAERGFHFYVS
jgi:hypothetical protein